MRSYNSTKNRARSLGEWRVLIRSSAFEDRVLAKSELEKRRLIAEAIASGSDGSTNKAAFLSATISGMPPTEVATTGTPAAMPSNNTFGEPSLVEEMAKTSAR